MSAALAREARAAAASWRPGWAAWWLLGLGGVGAGLALRAWTPVDDPAHAICALRQIAHVGCATCGLTRALAALARGDLQASLALHPMAAALVVQLAAAWVLWGAGLARGRSFMAGVRVPWVLAANGIAFMLLWIVRLATGTVPV